MKSGNGKSPVNSQRNDRKKEDVNTKIGSPKHHKHVKLNQTSTSIDIDKSDKKN